MDNEYFAKQLLKLSEARMDATLKQETFFQHILIVSSGILGIVISLHTNNSPYICIRLVFVLALILLALGCLTTAIALYDYSRLPDRASRDFQDELQIALREDRKANPVLVTFGKRTLFCQKACLILLPMGICVLTLYSILTVIFQ